MIIKNLEVIGFLGRSDSLRIRFHEDLNIITGYNGAGKTNLLKLLWYTISGNIHVLLQEVEFIQLILETSDYKVEISKISNNTCRGKFQKGSEVREFEDESDEFDDDVFLDARDRFKEVLESEAASIFFPTFRRIEGGFTISRSTRLTGLNLFNMPKQKSDLSDAVAAVSRKLSNNEHTFVTSISTFDIAELLLRRYNEMSEEAGAVQSRMSQDVIQKIRAFQRDTEGDSAQRTGQEAVDVLESIQTLIEEVDKRRIRIMAPLQAVQDLGAKIFKHKGIQINRRVNFGDTVNAINSELLSAGEKQMLSFICYNAFTDSSPIFIDEPELSLHVDWQRILFPTLESQKKSNQFIIATHSPFIYGKYPEKEIALVDNRGGKLVE